MQLCAAFQKVERSGDEQQRQRQLDNAPDEQPHYHQRQSHHEQHSSSKHKKNRYGFHSASFPNLQAKTA